MVDRSEIPAGYPRKAACGCGALSVTVTAAPRKVHACACLDCQRRSGGLLSYSAFFDKDATSMTGTFSTWRRTAESGRWVDMCFCPACGVTLLMRLEAYPDLVGVAVGCFGDLDFAPPGSLYWTSRRHKWFTPPAGIRAIETQ